MIFIDKNKFCMACARRCMGITQALKAAKLSTSVLNNINKHRAVSVRTLGKLAAALKCDPLDLVES